MFTKTPKGLLLSAYTAEYKSQKLEEGSDTKVFIEYFDLQELNMLQKVNVGGTSGGSPFAVELLFSDCRVVKEQ